MSNFITKETILTEPGVNGTVIFDRTSCGFALDALHAEHEIWCEPSDAQGQTATATVSLFNPLSGEEPAITTSWGAGDMPISLSSLGVFDETGSTKAGVIRPIRINVTWANSDGNSRVLLRSRMASD